MAKYSKMEIDAYLRKKSEMMFNFLDSDKDGIVSLKDMLSYPKKLKSDDKPEFSYILGQAFQGLWDRILDHLGKPSNTTDGVNREEFVEGMNSVRQTEWYVHEFVLDVVDVFYGSTDYNSEGDIDLSDWRAYYASRGIDNEKFVQETFNKMDVNGNGCVSREEFKHAFTQLGIGQDPDDDFSFLYDITHPC